MLVHKINKIRVTNLFYHIQIYVVYVAISISRCLFASLSIRYGLMVQQNILVTGGEKETLLQPPHTHTHIQKQMQIIGLPKIHKWNRTSQMLTNILCTCYVCWYVETHQSTYSNQFISLTEIFSSSAYAMCMCLKSGAFEKQKKDTVYLGLWFILRL